MKIVKGLIVIEHDDKALIVDIKGQFVGITVEPHIITDDYKEEFNAVMQKLYHDLEIWAKRKQEIYAKRDEKAD